MGDVIIIQQKRPTALLEGVRGGLFFAQLDRESRADGQEAR